MPHLKNHLLESYEDYIFRNPNWILEKNINQNDLQKYQVPDDYIRGQFEPLNTPVETAKQENIQ